MMTNGNSQAPRSLLSQEDILKEKERIERQYGKWTAHNLHLKDNIYTLSPPYDWAYHRGKWFGLLAEVLLRQPLRNLRILDIGCLEGGITLALGEAGGSVVGIEGREANLAKSNFARDVLGLF